MTAANVKIRSGATAVCRNGITIGNSGGRCLIENWVEERANIDRDPPPEQEHSLAERTFLSRRGHHGLLTIDDEAKVEKLTTTHATYIPQDVDKTRHVGIRKELMLQAFTKAVSGEILEQKKREEAEQLSKPRLSTYIEDYTREFPKQEFQFTRDHDYVSEQAVTFWSEHRDRIPGTTQAKTGDTAFRRNDAFSKPISESWGEPKPTEFDNYPMM